MNIRQKTHHELVLSFAEQYRSAGFEVTIEPPSISVPFDLDGYQPDLIATKDATSLIVEIKSGTNNVSFDRLRELVHETRRHSGWRFVLITAQDIAESDLFGEEIQTSLREELSHGILHADKLRSLGELESAYLILWVTFERTMRQRASQIDLPLERLVPSAIIKQLYSQGELSIPQFDTALFCQKIRNTIIHGFAVRDLEEAYGHLRRLLQALQMDWQKSSQTDLVT